MKIDKKFLPLLVLALGLILFFALDLGRFVSINALAEHYNSITAWVNENRLLALPVFFIIYMVAVAFSLPIGLPLTLAGGAVLGYVAIPVIVLGATLGAFTLFLAAKGALADVMAKRAGPFMAKVADGFNDSPFFWLLALRFIPAAPFWVVNIIPALLGMKARPYALATLVGIIPGTTVYVAVGRGFDAILAAGKAPDLSTLTDIRIIAPFIGLVVLALIPIIVKKFIKSKEKASK